MRAYIYFHLLRSWGDVILVTEPTLGNELDISHLEKAASPASEVMDQIKKDIDASVNALPVVIILTNMEKATGLNQPH